MCWNSCRRNLVWFPDPSGYVSGVGGASTRRRREGFGELAWIYGSMARFQPSILLRQRMPHRATRFQILLIGNIFSRCHYTLKWLVVLFRIDGRKLNFWNLEQWLTNCVQILKTKFMRLKCHGSTQAAGNSPDPPSPLSGNQTRRNPLWPSLHHPYYFTLHPSLDLSFSFLPLPYLPSYAYAPFQVLKRHGIKGPQPLPIFGNYKEIHKVVCRMILLEI